MLILASTSPRRIELIKLLGINYISVAPNFDEDSVSTQNINVEDYVMLLARKKAESVLINNQEDNVLSADTVVTINNEILNKPISKEDAFNQLRKLSGNHHYVITAVSLRKLDKQITFLDKVKVTFRNISDEEIHEYINTGEPMDKSGSYAIQGIAKKFIISFEGDVNTVVGLPVNLIKEKLVNF